MIDMMLKFSSFCRASDLKVSTSEVLDCFSHLELVDLCDQSLFKSVLKTNFVKTRRDQSNFDDLYDYFFHDLAPGKDSEALSAAEDLKKEILEQVKENNDDNPILDSIIDFLSGDPISFLEELRKIQNEEQMPAQVVKSNLGSLSSRLEIMLSLNKSKGRIMQLLDNSNNRNSDSSKEALKEYLNRRIETAHEMLSRENKPDNDGLKQVKSSSLPGSGLGEKFFSSLTMEEVEEMRDVISELVKKMKDMVTRRWAARSRGVLDVKKTLRRAGRYHGIPIDIVFKKRTPRKGRIVTLCDVSGSVWSAARFMLNMLYSLQDCFTKVRSFIFVSDLAEVTDIFEKIEINKAIENVMTETDINYEAPTDYGETFVQFKKSYFHSLNKKTTLIIVGDGRSNYFSPREDILDEMRNQCRRVIWLNPEQDRFWNDGDSEMNTYKRYCHEVRPCQNLNQLTSFIEELVL